MDADTDAESIRPFSKPPIHPFRDFRKAENKGMSPEDKMEHCISYLKKAELCRKWSQPKKSESQNPFTKCTCMQWVAADDTEDEREAIARYMMHYFDKTKAARQQLLMGLIRYAEEYKTLTTRRYFLPICDRDNKTTINNDDDDDADAYRKKVSDIQSYKVCKPAIGFILGVCKDAWLTCAKAVITNKIPQHGNKYNRSGRGKEFDKYVRSDLLAYFDGIQKQANQQRSTILSKRKLYEAFCSERGHTLKSTSKGYVATRDRDDAEKIPSWPKFSSFWGKEFPKLRLGKSNDKIITEHSIG
jgi:hypothetical protein